MLCAIIVVAFLSFNVISGSLTQKEILPLLCLENIEALAYELPEVDVVCGQESGRCWLTDKKLVGPVLPYYVTYCSKRTNDPNIVCVPGIPV